jgi:RNA polymerase sigma-70 factor, ECF subfamily
VVGAEIRRIATRRKRRVVSRSDPASRLVRMDASEVFEALRPRLLGVAYRILGSVTDAEDALQDAWVRWSRTDVSSVLNPEAYLVTVVGRQATDHLRQAKRRRESYTGSWLPEPVANEPDPALDPAAAAELADSLSMALLVVLETLSPLERAAFVLREVFDRPYAEVAATLGRSEQAVRQLVHRARGRVDEGHARFRADVTTHADVVSRFLAACQGADLDTLLEVLAPDVVIISDGGGQARAPRRPVCGQDKVARLLVGFAGRQPEGLTFGLEYFNGSVGIVARVGGVPIAAMAVTVAEGTVQSLQLIANPEKLAFLQGVGLR